MSFSACTSAVGGGITVRWRDLAGHQGLVLRMRAELRLRCVRNFERLRASPTLGAEGASSFILAENRRLRAELPELRPVLSALPGSRSGLHRLWSVWKRFGPDALVDQKIGRSGRKPGPARQPAPRPNIYAATAAKILGLTPHS